MQDTQARILSLGEEILKKITAQNFKSYEFRFSCFLSVVFSGIASPPSYCFSLLSVVLLFFSVVLHF